MIELPKDIDPEKIVEVSTDNIEERKARFKDRFKPKTSLEEVDDGKE